MTAEWAVVPFEDDRSERQKTNVRFGVREH